MKVKPSMYEALVITPVKDSLKTTTETINSIRNAEGNFYYCIFNDFSSAETTNELKSLSLNHQFELINLDEVTDTPSPNYRLVLQMAQEKALSLGLPLIIVESDVEVQPNTFSNLIKESEKMTESIPVLLNSNSDNEIRELNKITKPTITLGNDDSKSSSSNSASKFFRKKN